MNGDLQFAIVCLSAVFFVVDPMVAVPFFLAITRGDSASKRRGTANRAALTAFLTLSLFAVTGGVLFRLFGISLGAFKIAGGIMLLLMALDMMRAQPSRTRSTDEEVEEGAAREDVAIVPMAIPMLSGPGAIATVMVLMSRADWKPVAAASVLGAVAVTCFVAWVLMRWATRAEHFLPKVTLHALERVMGLLLAAVAIEFILSGLGDRIPGLLT